MPYDENGNYYSGIYGMTPGEGQPWSGDTGTTVAPTTPDVTPPPANNNAPAPWDMTNNWWDELLKQWYGSAYVPGAYSGATPTANNPGGGISVPAYMTKSTGTGGVGDTGGGGGGSTELYNYYNPGSSSGGLINSFDTGPLGLGLFQPGGYFGPQQTNPLDFAKAEQVMKLLQEEPGLYQGMATLLKAAPGAANEAYQQATGQINQVYPGVMDQIQNFTLSPNADQYLKNLRDERINALSTDANKLVGSKVADLNRRGMLSSSTMEGAMGDITSALAPSISQANEDYWNSKLTLPSQNAAQQYGMAEQYGTDLSNATNAKLASLYTPLSSMWQTSVGANNSATPPAGDASAGQKNLMNTIGSLASLFA